MFQGRQATLLGAAATATKTTRTKTPSQRLNPVYHHHQHQHHHDVRHVVSLLARQSNKQWICCFRFGRRISIRFLLFLSLSFARLPTWIWLLVPATLEQVSGGCCCCRFSVGRLQLQLRRQV